MNDQAPTPARNETTFLMIAGGLMVLIMALLAGLWLKASRRAAAAEDQLAQLRRRDAASLAEFKELLRSQPLIPAVDRDALPTREAVLDGKPVRAFRLPADVAERIGLAPGDVVLVEPAPATAPSTGPAPPETRRAD
ncbi:MAG TPA: AbrB/MazE/SpoVT family DNA-binding domain-containing protein [Phycisphaerae bacterium]|nr:AbrB/MazE/SpoVT family DNA-binding domain-containing protein [Phycisphaerae bacterium]